MIFRNKITAQIFRMMLDATVFIGIEMILLDSSVKFGRFEDYIFPLVIGLMFAGILVIETKKLRKLMKNEQQNQ